MGLKAGIVGLPNVGKSTLFNAITNSHVEAANYPFATIKPNAGIVAVKDKRLDFFASVFNPLRKIYSSIEFFDIAGLVKGASKGEGLGNQFLAHIRECDTIVHLVRCFDSKDIIHVEESVDPIRDIEITIYELNILNICKENLEKGTPIRLIKNLNEDERKFLKVNLHFLTDKPVIYVANVSDTDYGNLENCQYYLKVKEYASKENSEVCPISCEIEYEISQLEESEKHDYFSMLGISESGLDNLIRKTYKLLNLSTFFTVGKDECRAWAFRNGMTAPECAGIIHTDFQKGFIRAEVYSYEDFVEYKSEANLRQAGKIRIEGKDYIAKDGDVFFFRFNV